MRFPLLGLARDLHPLANAHAERTTKKRYRIGCLLYTLYLYLSMWEEDVLVSFVFVGKVFGLHVGDILTNGVGHDGK